MTSHAVSAMSARAGSFALGHRAVNRARGGRCGQKASRPAGRVSTVVRAAAKPRDDQPENWELKYLYDGGCTVCNSLVKLLKSKKGHEKIWFEDIADPKYSPDKNEGITFEEAMATIHVIKSKDATTMTGMEALTALYDITGMGWLFKLAKLPVLSSAAEIAYKVVSKNRQSMGGAADGLLALGRINMEEKGEGSCTDLEGECREPTPPVDEEAEAAEKAAEERRARIAAEKEAAGGAKSGGGPSSLGKNPAATSKGGLENAAREKPPTTSGSLSDRRNILGVYDMRRSKSDDRALRAAPVDTETGELIDELITIPLDDTELSTVAAALTSIIKHFAWQGNVGVAFPAIRVDTTAEAVNETMDSFDDAVGEMSSSAFAMEAGFAADKLVTSGKYEEMKKVRAEERKKALKAKSGAARLNAPLASQSAEISTAADSRQSRLEVENYLKNAVGRDVVVMSGPEATGYGEMNFRAEKLATGTTVCVNLGKTAGIALFDNGILAHNPADVERQLATFNYPRWVNAELPREENTPTEEEWKRWAMRVQHYLMRIEAVGRPDNFIIAGRASATFKYWSKHMTEVKTPFYNAEQGMNAAVLGAGKGASEILTLRRDTARVRAAIGHAKGLSPQKLDEEQLSAVFDELDEDKSGRLSLEELAVGINRLNVKLSEEEIKELFIEMDYEDTGDINKREFIAWWKDSIGNSDVEIIHTMNEYEQVLDDADGTDSLTVLMVGVTYCKPCKAFSKKYQDFADRFNGARFIKVFGNENKDMTVLCRDELKVKSTPTFYFFRNKEQVLQPRSLSRSLRMLRARRPAMLPRAPGRTRRASEQ
mmetsp:Transcript_8087/g.36296  ORF Transcript_8087/g.36296 Transcript_8087/m.36296 type:complete len:826 (-) Transcript_8087:111-2588(-)